MSIINYIKDCKQYAKAFPFRGGSRWTWIRNVLYCNAQPKYWHGRIITKII